MSVRVVETGAEVTRALRNRVLRAANPDYDSAPGDAPGSRHLAAYDGSDVVGAVAMLAEPCPLWPDRAGYRLRGMAVAPDRQGQGIGTLVLDAAVGLAADTGLIWCNARTTARPFYQRHGFLAVGDAFVTPDSGIEHFLMYRNLTGDPPRPTG